MNLNKIMKWLAFGFGVVGLLLGMIFYNLGNADASFWSLLICSFISVASVLTLETK